jgi:hypothetical protein
MKVFLVSLITEQKKLTQEWESRRQPSTIIIKFHSIHSHIERERENETKFIRNFGGKRDTWLISLLLVFLPFSLSLAYSTPISSTHACSLIRESDWALRITSNNTYANVTGTHTHTQHSTLPGQLMSIFCLSVLSSARVFFWLNKF